jgi:hypothetical protein
MHLGLKRKIQERENALQAAVPGTKIPDPMGGPGMVEGAARGF